MPCIAHYDATIRCTKNVVLGRKPTFNRKRTLGHEGLVFCAIADGGVNVCDVCKLLICRAQQRQTCCMQYPHKKFGKRGQIMLECKLHPTEAVAAKQAGDSAVPGASSASGLVVSTVVDTKAIHLSRAQTLCE